MSTTGEHRIIKRSDSKDRLPAKVDVAPSFAFTPPQIKPETSSMAETVPDIYQGEVRHIPASVPVVVSRSMEAKPLSPASTLSAVAENLIGGTIDKRFRLISRIGKGGMSEVYKAQHLLLGRTVAIKVLHPNEAAKENSVERFQQEAKAISALDHPNIVKVFAFGLSDNERFYLAMDYLEGESLAEIIESAGHVDWVRAVALASQIADGLAQAHSRGIIHRDLKPSNIIVQTDSNGCEQVKIVDFGIARLTSASGKEVRQLTAQGSTCGSPPYMSPEQCHGEPVDARSDIYSFGCMLFELLAGQRPFIAGNVLELMQMHVEQSPPFFKSVCPQIEIPESLESVIRKCLSKRAGDRFQSMSELLLALKAIGTASQDESNLKRILQNEKRQKDGRRPFLLAKRIAGAVCIFAISLSSVFFWHHHGLPQSRVLRLSEQFAKERTVDAASLAREFALLRQMSIVFASSPQGITDADRSLLRARLRQFKAQVRSSPIPSLRKCIYLVDLVSIYQTAHATAEATKLSDETLSALESFLAKETGNGHPDSQLIEEALLLSIRLCEDKPDQKDRIVGKYNILVSIYLADKKLQLAEQAALSALRIVQSQGAPNALAELSVRQNLAAVYMQEHKLSAAEEQLRRSWEICKRDWTIDCPLAKNLAKNLAGCLSAEGKVDEARRFAGDNLQ